MKPPRQPGVLLVAIRELRWMRRDGTAFFLAIGVPLIAFALLAWVFSDAVIRDLRVDIVDKDVSPTSMVYVQAIGSAPGLSVAERSSDLNGAMHAIRSGKALAAVYIPPDFERDLIARKRPQIVVFYNRQFMTPGSNANGSLTSAINSVTATLPPTSAGAGGSFSPGALVVEKYVLTNPALNYVQFLVRSVIPTILHVISAIAACYAVGSEFSTRNLRSWLGAAGGSPLAALVGKLMPLFAIFILMAVVGAVIVHGLFGIPFRGDSILMGAAACLLLIAYLSLGALLALVARKLPFGLSLVALCCSPAFGYAGIGFPVMAMNEFAQIWGNFLPLRWYITILFDQAVRGLPVYVSAQPFAVLGGMAIGFFALGWLRLRDLSANAEQLRRTPDKAVVITPTGHGVGAAMVAEIRRVLGDFGVLGMIVLGPLVYGAFYPQPYLGQLLRKLPVAVVDQDRTELSRNFVQNLNADQSLTVSVRADTLAQAQMALARREVYGIVEIPEGTERESLKGDNARVVAYIDSAYFLIYSTISGGISEAAGAVNLDIATRGARMDGSLAHAGTIKSSPVELLSEPLFNPTGGYASYAVPGAFMLIIQQTVLMGAATVGGVAAQTGGRAARRRRSGFRAVIGQGLAHLCLAAPGVALYSVILPRVYGFSTLGSVLDITLMAVPFVLSVSFLAQFISAWFNRRETPVLVCIAFSMPLFFMVGMAWPLEAIPEALRTASHIFPSTSAIDGLVRINQMGATLHDVSRDWINLWILVGVYGLLAAVATRLMSREEDSHGA